jgi:predicted O-methyltransferase YrrM
LHSPFVFDFYTQVVKPEKHYYIFEEIEEVRQAYLQSDKKIDITDYGAGSQAIKSRKRKVADIANYSVSQSDTNKLLFKIIDYYQPKTILELGTCLGINTLYLAAAHKDAKVITFEGAESLANEAKEKFKQLDLNPEIVLGNIDTTLPKVIDQLDKVDLIFFDANHKYKPTLAYFDICLEKAHEDSIFIFDDIHWSPGMSKAWNKIRKHPKVTLSMDFFQVGIVLFRKKQPKQHFTLKM